MVTAWRLVRLIAPAAGGALLTTLSVGAGVASLAAPASARPAAGPCAPGVAYDAACDVDHDGDVDILDIQLAAGHWNQAGPWSSGSWDLAGNAGTTPSTHFVGTTDLEALELQVAGQRALRLEPIPAPPDRTRVEGALTPNVIGGHGDNTVTLYVQGAAIGGGGSAGFGHQILDNFGTIGGGWHNQAGDGAGTVSDRSHATVSGGADNWASGSGATVGGGVFNAAHATRATVAGGEYNLASAGWATVGGGYLNQATSSNATVAGGAGNVASENSAAVGGGSNNTASRRGLN